MNKGKTEQMTRDHVLLTDYDWIVVNSSGGKDSQAALRSVVQHADKDGFPRSRIWVSHQRLGRMEWPGTEELVQTHAQHYGLVCHISQYRDRYGNTPDLLSYVRRRGRWPDSANRYCTSEFKRGPGGRVLTKAVQEVRRERDEGSILNVYGFRADESPARRKKNTLSENRRFNRKGIKIFDWLPIHTWTEKEVWADIRASGVPHHPAYDLGMPRLSCSFCIFAPRAALILAGRARPDLLDEYVLVEKDCGHTFRHKESLADIKQAIEQGEEAKDLQGEWNM